MICDGCGKESASNFNFCPHCGKAFIAKPSVIESPSPSPEAQSVADTLTDESESIKDGVAGAGIRVGTWVFGAFSAISLVVSMAKGIVPIYLLEAAGWAGAAWYWQAKKTHSDVAKAIVIVLAVLVGIGEVVHIVSQAGSKPNIFDDASNTTTSTSPYAVSGSRSSGNFFDPPTDQTPTITEETQGQANSNKTQPKTEPKPRNGTNAGLEATVTCDNTVWDRDEFGDGDPKAIANLHKGDIVQYLGHVTISGRDIIRIHGRKGYVEGCVDVKLRQDTGNTDESQPKTEPKPRNGTNAGLEATATCDAIVWDRDEFGDGDPMAITSVHKGDIVRYLGHVTISGRDIIRIHGRKGYVEGCVDVKQ